MPTVLATACYVLSVMQLHDGGDVSGAILLFVIGFCVSVMGGLTYQGESNDYS